MLKSRFNRFRPSSSVTPFFRLASGTWDFFFFFGAVDVLRPLRRSMLCFATELRRRSSSVFGRVPTRLLPVFHSAERPLIHRHCKLSLHPPLLIEPFWFFPHVVPITLSDPAPPSPPLTSGAGA